jgi:uncharacterized protein
VDAVLDANIAVSAGVSPYGAPAAIVRQWRAGAFAWLASPELIAEIEGVFAGQMLRRRLAWNEAAIQQFLAEVNRSTRIVQPESSIHVLSDEADNRLLEAAVVSGADYIVTGDRALLELAAYEGTEIVSPVRFVAILTGV